MNKIIYALLTLAALTSCANSYNIQGSSDVQMLDGRMLYLKVFKNSDLKNVDSCDVVHGKFQFTGTVDSTRMATLFMDDESIMPVVIERGEINIKIDNSQQKVSGTPLNDKLTAFLDEYNQLQRKMEDLGHKQSQAIMDGEDENVTNARLNEEAARIADEELGGITVDIPEDLTKWNIRMKEGEKDYLLKGDDAVIFVARRDISIDDSAMGRMKRQVQYMKKLFPAFKSATVNNITYPISLYKSEADKVNTNLSLDEMTYLAKLLLDLELDERKIASVPGEMKRIEEGEIEDYEYEMGFIVDEDALKQLIIDRYYVETEEQ